jgi:hypothetical protein
MKKLTNPLNIKPKSRRFAQLQDLQDDRGFSNSQFEPQQTPSKYIKYKLKLMHIILLVCSLVPWKAIGLASLLFLVGGGLLAVGILIKIGTITSDVCT